MHFFRCLSSDHEVVPLKRDLFSFLNCSRADCVADGNVAGRLSLYEFKKSAIERSRRERSSTRSGSFIGVKTFIFWLIITHIHYKSI